MKIKRKSCIVQLGGDDAARPVCLHLSVIAVILQFRWSLSTVTVGGRCGPAVMLGIFLPGVFHSFRRSG